MIEEGSDRKGGGGLGLGVGGFSLVYTDGRSRTTKL